MTDYVTVSGNQEPQCVAIRSGLGGAAFTPASLSGLALWLRADLGVTVNGSTQVTAWADQSGNNNNATTFSNLQPLVASDSNFNNQATIQMNRVANGSLIVPYAATINPSLLTLFIVYKYSTIPTTFSCVVSAVNTGAWTDGFAYGDVSGSANSTGAFVTQYTVGPASATLSTSLAKAAVVTYDGTTLKVYHDNSLFASSSPNNGNIHYNGNNQLVISGFTSTGGTGTTLGFCGVDIAEVAMWNRVLSGSELTQLHTYDVNRYALP